MKLKETSNMNIDITWLNATQGLRSVILGVMPWGFLAIGILLTDSWYSRHSRS